MFDAVALKAKYDLAQPFVDEYHARQLRTQIQMVYRDSKECTDEEREIIDEWLTNNGEWLQKNEEKYNQYLAIAAIPKDQIEALLQ